MTPKRMDGYVRVSRVGGREGPGYISPDVQREAIARWAEYKGVELAEVWVDEDWSGGTQERPGLEAAVARALAGETGGIVSWKIDRFSRYTEGGLRDLRRLEEVDARLAFVVEDIDTSGPMGKFVYTLMLAMSEYFLDNIKAGWKTAKTRAVGRGAKIGPAPYGYRHGHNSVLERDPVTGPIVAETFRLAAQQGFDAALAYGVEHGDGRLWTTTTLRRLLRNRSYLGEARYGELVNEEAHEPLVSASTFAAAQPEQGASRRPRRTYPLSGLARCASCGGPLVGTRAGGGIRAYRCSAAAQSRRLAGVEPCSAPAFASAEPLEALVRATLAAHLRDRVYAGGDDPAGLLEAAAAELAEARRQLDDLLGDVELRRIVGADRFRQMAEDVVVAVDEKQATYEGAARRAERRLLVPAVELLESAEPDELGELLRGALEAVIVERGRRPMVERVRLVPRGGAPDEVWTPTPEDTQSSGVEAGMRRRR